MTMMQSIYAARRAIGLDDDTARALYERVTGKRHLTDMTPGQQVKVLQELNRSTGGATRSRKRLEGPYAKKLIALWLDGFNLGVFRVRTDAALLSFLERQTKIQNTRFLRDAADAVKAIEALKGWLARDGGVVWGEHQDPLDDVIAAQGKKLGIEHVDLNADPAELEGGRWPIGMDVRDVEAFTAWRTGELGKAEKIAISQKLGQSIRDRRS